MFDIGIDILRGAIVGAIFLYLRSMRGRKQFHLRKGWILILIGFGLIFFGSVVNITDHFPSLNKFVIIGKTKYQDFLEEVVGYLFGCISLAIGFWKWMPAILALREEEVALKKSKQELRLKIEELTAEFNAVRIQLEQSKARSHEGHVSS